MVAPRPGWSIGTACGTIPVAVENLDHQGDGIRTPDSDLGTADADGSDSIVAAQALFRATSADEMLRFEFVKDDTSAEFRSALERRSPEGGRWGPEFEVACGTPKITYDRIAEAIAIYEQSQVFTNTPWRACRER